MQSLTQLTFAQGLAFLLVLCRVGGMIALAPAFGAFLLPWRIRGLLAVAITLVMAPACGTVAMAQLQTPEATPQFACQFALLAGSELLIGAALGLGVAILLNAALMAGQLVSQLGGTSMADVLQGEGNQPTSAYGQLVYLVALAGYLTLGGQRLLIGALMETFRKLPLGRVASVDSLGQTAVTLVAQSFDLGLRGAAPALAALLLATIALAIVGRSIPQLNVMSLGIGVNSLAAMAVLTATVGLTVHLVGNRIEPTLAAVLESISPEKNVTTESQPGIAGTK
jgi:flagellar biosynthetic protein FliR